MRARTWGAPGEEAAAPVTAPAASRQKTRHAGRMPLERAAAAGWLARVQTAAQSPGSIIVRSRATEWGINPSKIGMVGFSAGGHLALATATNFEKRRYEAIDAIDEVSCRPDFAVLCYSGYLKAKDKDEISPGLHIPANTPPILLAHANDDSEKVGGSNAEHSAFMYIALKRAGLNLAFLIVSLFP